MLFRSRDHAVSGRGSGWSSEMAGTDPAAWIDSASSANADHAPPVAETSGRSLSGKGTGAIYVGSTTISPVPPRARAVYHAMVSAPGRPSVSAVPVGIGAITAWYANVTDRPSPGAGATHDVRIRIGGGAGSGPRAAASETARVTSAIRARPGNSIPNDLVNEVSPLG